MKINGFIAFVLILSFSQFVSAQEQEAVDIEGLRNQLESSNAQTHKSPDSHLQNQKESLEKEEEALMKKLEKSKAEPQQKELPVKELEIEKDVALDSSSSFPKEDETLADAIEQEKEIKVVKEEVKIAPVENKVVEQKNAVSEKSDNSKVGKLEKANADLRSQQASLRAKLDEKNKELEETRNRLVIAETQVERLSGILEKINNQKLAGYLGGGDSKSVSVSNNTSPSYQAKASVNPVSATKTKDEAMVGIVTVQKAYLRSGPSKDDSPIMSVSKGTRLVVETRNNEWYRVITPTGGRAWISTQMLSFGPGANPGSNSALRIGGYESTPR